MLWRISKPLIGCILSAFLLVISYPQIQCWPLAWVAFAPLFFIFDQSKLKGAFGWGYLFAFLFFFGTLGWLVSVTYPGTILLCLYLSLFPAFFGLGFVYFQKLPLIPRVFVLASLWATLEFVRATLFTGFGWVTVGHSQYKNLLLVQIADIIGLYGISFLVILVNLFVFETLRMVFQKKMEHREDLRRLQYTILAILMGCLFYGLWTFTHTHFTSIVKVSVVQPNIAQEIKWDERYMPSIVKKTLDLSDQAAQSHPDLILWPETSLPGVFSEEPAYVEQIQLKALDLKMPILMGAILNEKDHYYNAAILIAKDGKMIEHYNKIHLVPFGEFLPLRPMLGWLNRYIGLEDFTSGDKYTLFPIKGHKFGVLICFEDALNDLWRDFTKSGAEVMMNITNDAWFLDTKEPFLHLQGAVFECLMNKRSLIRAANTGVSGFIDPLGRIVELAHDAKGKKTFVTAVDTAEVPLNNTITFYTKYADVFTSLCFVCILWGLRLRRTYAQKNIISR
jgi:apolipoprotein N-acyltransferase